MGVGGALLAVASGFQLARANYEQPAFVLERSEGAFSVRRYGARVVAETHVDLPGRDAATNAGFSRLAGYIFGGNHRATRVAMTTPVEIARGERIAMTSPVEASPSDDGWRVTFTMPSRFRVADLPIPDDRRIVLRELPPERFAVLRFAGRATDRARRGKEAELRRWIDDHGYLLAGAITLAVYDPPHLVLPPFRRNEVLAPVRRVE